MHNARLCKTFTFDAAHQLPNHDGKCRRPHGHTYRVDVLAYGKVKPQRGASDDGMVVDFDTIKRAWKSIEGLLDHQDLNVTLADRTAPSVDVYAGDIPESVPLVPPCVPTTAENIAMWILRHLNYHVPEIYAVRVWETPTSYAETGRAEFVLTDRDGEWDWKQ